MRLFKKTPSKSDYRLTIAVLKSELDERNASYNRLIEEANDLRGKVRKLQTENIQFAERVEELESDLADWRDDALDLKAQLLRERHDYQQHVEKQREYIHSLNKTIYNLEQSLGRR